MHATTAARGRTRDLWPRRGPTLTCAYPRSRYRARTSARPAAVRGKLPGPLAAEGRQNMDGPSPPPAAKKRHRLRRCHILATSWAKVQKRQPHKEKRRGCRPGAEKKKQSRLNFYLPARPKITPIAAHRQMTVAPIFYQLVGAAVPFRKEKKTGQKKKIFH